MAGLSCLLDAVIASKIIAFLFKHDLGDPFIPLITVVNSTHATGIRLIYNIRTEHFQAGTIFIMEIRLWITLTSAAYCPSILQIGLPDIYLIATVAPAVPDMESIFLPCVRQHCEHPEPFTHPVFQGRYLPAASGIPSDQPPFCSLYRVAAVTLAKP